MEELLLNGEEWELFKTERGGGKAYPASVPGCVHTDLLSADAISDPFYRDNEQDLLWIGETDWTYTREFEVETGFLAHSHLLLRCEGLDTIASIFVNGEEVGSADNMFRIWEFDVEGRLVSGKNRITICFTAPMKYTRGKEEEFRLPAWGVGDHKLTGGGWIRKEPCNFGWDWGPMVPTCGIWRDIKIVAYDAARLNNLHIRQDHSQPNRVGLRIGAAIETEEKTELELKVRVSCNGREVAVDSEQFFGENTRLELGIENPRLWWPNGMGEQPLYELEAVLCDTSGKKLDSWKQKIGLRTIRLERRKDRWGETFQFAVNGVPFFAKGANWIPADAFVTRLEASDYTRLLNDAAGANMNMLRVWGGGIYEQPEFYETCDRLGILIWQDFIFSCATYPAFCEDFLANVRQEALDNVRRLRHHPSLALWCGNNELEQGLVGDEWSENQMSWDDYRRLFDDLLCEVVHKEDPDRDYWPGSPHSPSGDRRDFNNPHCGDAHLWAVWHGKKPFEWYRGCLHRFNSEFGFQSFPEPLTVESFTEPEDRSVNSRIMEHHQRSGIGNTTIIHYMLDWFRLPKSFDMLLWTSQILQGLAIKYAVEHWRRSMPRGMGTLYWQLNDCWPVASWSSLDYYGRWKALHYMAHRFYAPLLISGVENAETGEVDIHITSDLMEDARGRLSWRVTDLEGKELACGDQEVFIPLRKSEKVMTLYVKQNIGCNPENVLLWLELDVEGRKRAKNLIYFSRPRHLPLRDPKFSMEIAAGEQEFEVRVDCEHPAMWTWLEVDGLTCSFDDNFFHLAPGESHTVAVIPEKNLDLEEFTSRLTIRSLYDTYRS